MKFFVLLLTAFISIARTFGVEHDNKVNLNERIYGGITAVRSEFPWQVSVQSALTRFAPTNMLCGGSIISRSWVLTASRCVFRRARFDIGVGTVRLYNPLYTVSSIVAIPHPNYNPVSLINNIALIKLNKPLIWIPNQVQPILLARASSQNLIQQTCFISGWGQTPSMAISPVLLFTKVHVSTNKACGVSFGGTICTIGTVQKACHRDFGGALVYNEGILTKRFAQIGVFSHPRGGVCNGKLPGIYTRITYYLSWIKANTGIPIRP